MLDFSSAQNLHWSVIEGACDGASSRIRMPTAHHSLSSSAASATQSRVVQVVYHISTHLRLRSASTGLPLQEAPDKRFGDLLVELMSLHCRNMSWWSRYTYCSQPTSRIPNRHGCCCIPTCRGQDSSTWQSATSEAAGAASVTQTAAPRGWPAQQP